MARILRRRARPAPPRIGAGWVLPHWMETAGAASSNDSQRRRTTIGNLDSEHHAAVDRRGLVTLAGRRWSLDWWIGAEDRWHVPAREAAVRQGLLGATPVVETRVRVPGGDAVQRAFAARDPAGHEALVVEVENQTSVPFALALAIRPYDLDGMGAVHEVGVDGDALLVDGAVVANLPRPPRHAVASTGADGDSAEVVFSGEATGAPPAFATCPDGLAQLAVLLPVPHTATLRVVLPLAGGMVEPAALPDAANVVAGWQAHARQGTRIEVPDRRLQAAVDSSLRHLLLRHGGDMGAAVLDRLGFPEAMASLLADPTALARSQEPGSTLASVVEHWSTTSDPVLAGRLAAAVAVLVESVGPGAPAARRRSRDRRLHADDVRLGAARLPLTAELLATAGHQRGAGDVRRVAEGLATVDAGTGTSTAPSVAVAVADAGVADGEGRLSPTATLAAARAELANGDPTALARLAWVLGAASPTWTWPTALAPDGAPGSGVGDGHDPSANAALLRLVRDLLVDDASEPGGVVLGRLVPEPWVGQGWELHDAPTVHGRLSYAVRWHGERPALLWDLEPARGDIAPRITAPGLDRSWSTNELRGEALLSPVPMPARTARKGLTIPVSIEAAARGRG